MRHQHRHRHRAQNGPGHAPEDELAQARMAVAAYDHEPGATVGGMRQDRARHVEAASGGDAFDLDLDAMTGEMAAHIGAGDLAALVAFAADHHDLGFRRRARQVAPRRASPLGPFLKEGRRAAPPRPGIRAYSAPDFSTFL